MEIAGYIGFQVSNSNKKNPQISAGQKYISS